MKRFVLLSAIAIACISASAQVPKDLESKIRREVERQKPKHSQSNSTEAAAVAAKQAAITAQTNAAVAKAQQQAQYIDQAHTAEGLMKEHSVKPKVPAGAHTATNYSLKTGKGISFGVGAGKSNATINIDNAETKQQDSPKQGQWGTIGGEGKSYNPTYKNAKQFVNRTQQEQNRPQRKPTGIDDQNVAPQNISKSPDINKYPSPQTFSDKQPTTQDASQESNTDHSLSPSADVQNQMNCANYIVRVEGPYNVYEMNRRYQTLNNKAMADMVNHKVPQIPVPVKRVDKQYDIILTTNPQCLKRE